MSVLTKKWGFICRTKRLIYKLLYKDKLELNNTVTFRNGFHILIDENGVLKIGKNTFFNNYCSITSKGNVTIGDNCLFGENVKIYDHNHRFRDESIPIATQGFSIGKVSIGNNCWIGTNAVILKGAHIGDHCVISAGTVVDFKVPERTIVYRNGVMKEITP